MVRKKVHERKLLFWLLLFSMRNIRSLIPSLLEDVGKLLNESVPSLLISFNASPLFLSGGDEARHNPSFGNTAADHVA